MVVVVVVVSGKGMRKGHPVEALARSHKSQRIRLDAEALPALAQCALVSDSTRHFTPVVDDGLVCDVEGWRVARKETAGSTPDQMEAHKEQSRGPHTHGLAAGNGSHHTGRRIMQRACLR